MTSDVIQPGEYGMDDPKKLLRYAAGCLCREKPASPMAIFWSKVFWRCVEKINENKARDGVWLDDTRPLPMYGMTESRMDIVDVQKVVSAMTVTGLHLASAAFIMLMLKKGNTPAQISELLESLARIDDK